MKEVTLRIIGTNSDIDIPIVRAKKTNFLPEDEFISEVIFSCRHHDEDFLLFRLCHEVII